MLLPCHCLFVAIVDIVVAMMVANPVPVDIASAVDFANHIGFCLLVMLTAMIFLVTVMMVMMVLLKTYQVLVSDGYGMFVVKVSSL